MSTKQLAPALRALAHADLEADEFLLSFRRGPENDQHALGLRLHPGLKVDAVRPDVDIPPRREIAALPAVVFLLPLPGQARDHARRQVRRILPQDRGQRLLEIPRRDAAQIEDRQQRIEAARAPRPFRQDRRGEADLLVGRAHRRRGRAPSGAARRAPRSRSGCCAPARNRVGQRAGGRPAGSLRHAARRRRRPRPSARPPASGAPRHGQSRSAGHQQIPADAGR